MKSDRQHYPFGQCPRQASRASHQLHL
jgi:hypothetical protein